MYGSRPLSDPPFTDLPAALVENVLEETAKVAASLLESLRVVKESRTKFRKDLAQLVKKESSLARGDLPTTCAADGSYAIDRLLTTDLAAAAALAVEGLTPPSQTRYWHQPHYTVFIAAEPHSEDTATVLRAVMLGEELCLARKAPHDLVMLDGTLTLPIIYFNQALNTVAKTKELECCKKFLANCNQYLEAYLEILRSERSDKQYVALPKYSTRREIGKKLNWPSSYDDRGMLTLLLEAGELTEPTELEHPRNSEGDVTWHLNTEALPDKYKEEAKKLAEDIRSALEQVQVLYYKPHDWLPALRVEVAASVARNNHRLGTVIQGLKHQCATSSILEPYPIYLADRFAKALARAMPAFRQATTQRVSEAYEGEPGEVFFALHGYRSEAGR